MTDLLAAVSGIAPETLETVVPPACRRSADPAPPAALHGEDVVVSSPAWRPRRGALHLLPSFAALDAGDYSARFEISALAGGAWSAWVGAATLGPAVFGPIASRAVLDGGGGATLASDVDVFTASAPVDSVRLRLRLRGITPVRLSTTPWMLTLSACDAGPQPAGASPAGPVRLEVPARSQLAEGGTVGPRICSPASVAMVLAYWGRAVDLGALAADMFHRDLDIYGVWPAAVRAAACHGLAGYLLRFPDWASAAWCLERGLPIIASVRYRAGELTGAAIAETTGHLVVLTGYEGDTLLVNDPAAATADTVARRYALEEVRRVWLERAGVGYVLFDPARVGAGVTPAR